jgi:hypothetical protein
LSAAEANTQATLHQLVFQFVNNGGHSDRTASDENLRSIINFSVKNAPLLKNFQHLGKNKYADIRFKTYMSFVSEVTELVDKCRQYYIDVTVSDSIFDILTISYYC